jgi:transposase-like protein
MARRPRRNHSPAFKAKVALEAIRGELTLVQLCEKHDVHANQIGDWKHQLLERAATVFGASGQPGEPPPDLKVLHAKIGQQALEIDFLEGALTKAGMLSAKR